MSPVMEFTRQEGKLCDGAMKERKSAFDVLRSLFFNADLGAYLITLRKISPQVNFANFAIQKNSRN